MQNFQEAFNKPALASAHAMGRPAAIPQRDAARCPVQSPAISPRYNYAWTYHVDGETEEAQKLSTKLLEDLRGLRSRHKP